MRSQAKKIRRPLSYNELETKTFENIDRGDTDLNEVVQKISLENVSLEKRREEASKPLYLVRYE